jgi:nitrite reductase/ring-hydroxylating ferredoxin subunit
VTETFVAELPDFADDTRYAVSVGTATVVVLRHGERFYAFENKCAHSGGPVGEGTILGRVEAVLGPDQTCLGERFSDTELHLICPWHGWEYDLETGEYAGDRSVSLRRYDVVERDGNVYVSS